jgi:putative transposase
MVAVSKDTPCFYLTSVTKDRLPVFRTDRMCEVACNAIIGARKSGGFLILAYVIMPDHLHVITDGRRKSAEVLPFLNGIISRRVIDYLKENNYQASLAKLRIQEQERGYKYTLWQHHADVKLLWSEEILMQRVHYTHQNPARAGLVEAASDYRWSSWRCWKSCPLDDEPLLVNIKEINWRNRG